MNVLFVSFLIIKSKIQQPVNVMKCDIKLNLDCVPKYVNLFEIATCSKTVFAFYKSLRFDEIKNVFVVLQGITNNSCENFIQTRVEIGLVPKLPMIDVVGTLIGFVRCLAGL